jgi:O-acetylserine/cysteine efflux transporter
MRISLADFWRTLGVMAIWGLNFPVSKIGLVELPPILLVALRFTVVALVLVPFVRFPRGQLVHLLPVSLTLGGVHFSLMFTGLARTDASMAALLGPMQIPFAALMAALVFGERVTLRLVVGFLVSFAGLALIAGGPHAADPVPILLILAAGIAWAISNIQLKAVAGLEPYSVTAWIALLSAPQLFLISLVLEENHIAVLTSAGWRGWGAVLFQAVFIAIVSYTMWYQLLRRYPVNIMMPMTLLTPVFGVLFSVLLLGEHLTLQLVAGGLVTLSGVAVTALRR